MSTRVSSKILGNDMSTWVSSRIFRVMACPLGYLKDIMGNGMSTRVSTRIFWIMACPLGYLQGYSG